MKQCPYSMVQHTCGLDDPCPDVCRKCLKEMAGITGKSQGNNPLTTARSYDNVLLCEGVMTKTSRVKMTKWRPGVWINPHLQDDALIFEAGADAILDALRSNQLSPFDNSYMQANFRGKVVIVPDDEIDNRR